MITMHDTQVNEGFDEGLEGMRLPRRRLLSHDVKKVDFLSVEEARKRLGLFYVRTCRCVCVCTHTYVRTLTHMHACM